VGDIRKPGSGRAQPSKASEGDMSTLYDKILKTHTVYEAHEEVPLLYVDSHIVYEITSPQAFESLRQRNRGIRRPHLTIATVDHNIPTLSRKQLKASGSLNNYISDPQSGLQVSTLERNVRHHRLTYFGLEDSRQGIVHVLGPEQGFSQPGTILVCGDSHTGTNGAFGNLSLGIGTSEVEHVLATQTIRLQKFKNMRINVTGTLPSGTSAKDLMLHIIGKIGFAGATGHIIEYSGEAIRRMGMEARMTMCNMSIEAGGRAGLIAPDEVTFKYLKNKPFAPRDKWCEAVSYWRTMVSDEDAKWDKEVVINAGDVVSTVTWGTTPQDIAPVDGYVPDLATISDDTERQRVERSLKYMGLTPGMPVSSIKVDKIFIGSCTNARLTDLRSAASILRGRTIHPSISAIVVPGSGLVKAQAEEEGLDRVFMRAGFEWREAGCSMCPGINPDRLKRGERCASTSNRNFEDRQGPGGRTHLMSPATAAATAIRGYIADVKDFPPLFEDCRNETGEFNAIPLATGEGETQMSTSVELAPLTLHHPSEKLPVSHEPTLASPRSDSGLRTLEGIAAPLHLSNIDTDMLIPGRYLAVITKSGLGKALFTSLRYTPSGDINPSFVLNIPPYTSSKFLIVTGENFGCGSSREHAVWALKDFGIRVVMAPSFAGIFHNNAFKNGLLPVVIPRGKLLEWAKIAESVPEGSWTLDLLNQTITSPFQENVRFDVDEFKKYCMLNALDEIDLALKHEREIKFYEEWRAKAFPWLEETAGYSKLAKHSNIFRENSLQW
jgi:3-isopropylmalate dehydratase